MVSMMATKCSGVRGLDISLVLGKWLSGSVTTALSTSRYITPVDKKILSNVRTNVIISDEIEFKGHEIIL